jgi:glyoxylase-like metal-dependent hydrolase (beta-lactamase superfamily II)
MEYERLELDQPRFGTVNVLRIGETLVDTGHVASVSRDALSSALSGQFAGVERVFHTHPHIDHVGGSQTIAALSSLPHVVPEGQPEILHDYGGYLRRAREEMTRLLAGFGVTEDEWDDYFPLGEYAEDRIDVARTVSDGDRVRLSDEALSVVSTPGHADPHIALYHEPSGTLFSGDLVDSGGQFQYGPLLGDVGAYERSLERVRELAPERLVPMHGPTISDPEASVDASLDRLALIRERLRTFRDSRGRFFAREFVFEDLGVTDERAGFLTLVVYEYVRDMASRGELSVEVTDRGVLVTA